MLRSIYLKKGKKFVSYIFESLSFPRRHFVIRLVYYASYTFCARFACSVTAYNAYIQRAFFRTVQYRFQFNRPRRINVPSTVCFRNLRHRRWNRVRKAFELSALGSYCRTCRVWPRPAFVRTSSSRAFFTFSSTATDQIKIKNRTTVARHGRFSSASSKRRICSNGGHEKPTGLLSGTWFVLGFRRRNVSLNDYR